MAHALRLYRRHPRSAAATAIVAAAAIYWIAGRLALWMAIPPGYATAVWPAAGLALICALVWRTRAAAGIAIGSCMVNLATSFDGDSVLGVVRSFAIAGAIAGGAALQAMVGSALIRRRIGFPNSLHDERDIVWFIVLGGPIACLTNASIGVLTLTTAGVMAWSAAAFSWWTWWIGDTIGVLVFAPLAILALPNDHSVLRRRRVVVGIPLVLGFAAVTALFLRVSAWERARIRTDFEHRAAPVEAVLKSQLSNYEEVVTSLVSFFDASVDVERSEFHAFCARAVARYPAILALSWNPRVAASDRAAFEAHVRTEGLTGFAISERAADGLRTAGDRAEYMPIYYIEPPDASRALGFDNASDAVRRTTFEQIRRGHTLTATPQVELVLGDGRGGRAAGVLLIAPVYLGATDQLRGYAIGAFRLRDLLETVLRDIDHDGMHIALVDHSADAAHALLYVTDAPASDAPELHFPLAFGGRQWQLAIAPTAAFMATQRGWQAWTVLAAGLLFVGLLGVILLMTTGRAFRLHEGAERLRALADELDHRVQARTSELSAALREREVLLQEIHHRVKNNLQVISSLINMQVRKLTDRASRDALEECQTRVQAIALIHEKLYQSRDYARVPFSEYSRTLARNVFHMMGISPGAVDLELAIADVSVPVDKAIPCGLVLNELISNSLKHAFKRPAEDGRRGQIRVELSRSGDRLSLTVHDNGVGLPAGLDIRGARSFGLQLVTTLAEQLDATLTVTNRDGACFTLELSVESE